MKKDLSDKCEESFIHCTNVVELLGVLQTDVIHKEEACEIEKSTLEMKNNIANISRKPEINRCIRYINIIGIFILIKLHQYINHLSV